MSTPRLQVAVVDDDASFARAIGRRLRAAGIDSIGFASAEAFLEGVPYPEIQCVLLDIQLGGMSGLDLARRLAAQRHAPPVILVTAHDEPELREEARQIGCAAYLRKPVPGALLLEAIQNAVQASAPGHPPVHGSAARLACE